MSTAAGTLRALRGQNTAFRAAVGAGSISRGTSDSESNRSTGARTARAVRGLRGRGIFGT